MKKVSAAPATNRELRSGVRQSGLPAGNRAGRDAV